MLADLRRPKLKEVEADLKEAEQIVGCSRTSVNCTADMTGEISLH